MVFTLWLLAVILVVYGFITFSRGDLLLGAIFVLLGLLAGPGGVSLFT